MNGTDLLSTLDRLPPFICRLLALDKRRPLSTAELAAKSGLSKATIKTLARSESWLGFELKTIIKFTNACGVDLLHQTRPRQKLIRMMRGAKGPSHLNHPQRRYWNSIFTGDKNWRSNPSSK